MANSYFIRGTGHWMKVLGKPVPNYGRDGFEWTFEVKPDAAGVKLLKDLKLGDRITKGEDNDRILFRQRAQRQNGDDNPPISVVDANNQPWPQDKLLGNGTVIDVKFNVKDYGKGKKLGMYPQAIRVLEHVEYKKQEFAPLNEEDEFFRNADVGDEVAPDFKRDFDLDDDIPE